MANFDDFLGLKIILFDMCEACDIKFMTPSPANFYFDIWNNGGDCTTSLIEWSEL